MRLWSLHPQYLDTKWLLAVWREGLLAKHVLEWKTKWYKNHPQLIRFRATENPLQAINEYLQEIVKEAKNRWYHFDESKICTSSSWTRFRIPSNAWDAEINLPAGRQGSAWQSCHIRVTSGQILYETKHLKNKLTIRDSERAKNLPENPILHPMFQEIPGEIEPWERV